MNSLDKKEKLSFATWNVNSIRARHTQIETVLKNYPIDVLMLQETKVQDHHFPIETYESMGYNIEFFGQKSYNGVAIISKIPFDFCTKSLPLYDIEEQDDEARYIECTMTFNKKVITFASIYVPNGQSILQIGEKLEESRRFQYKLNFFKRLHKRIQENFNTKEDYIIFGGDYNVANEPIDLHDPKRNEGGVGFHILERNNLKTIISLGLKDAFRELNPDLKAYSWWDYKTKGFERDVGWRLDTLFCSEKVMQNMHTCKILKEARKLNKASDHTLVYAEIMV